MAARKSLANFKGHWSVAALVLLMLHMGTSALAADAATPVKIAVFSFELEDKSAGAGIIAQDERDTKYLTEATDEAKRLLAASGDYTIIDATGADLGSARQYGLRNCGGCEAKIARKLGAEQAMLGVVTRVNRTEFTLLMRISDAATGKAVSQGFTDLRMGANYAWPRGVKWLMDKKASMNKKKSPG